MPHVIVPRPPADLPALSGRHRVPLPADAVGGYAPRTQAITARLAAGHRLGKQAISQAMNNRFGLPSRPAAVCNLQTKTATTLEPIHTAP